MSLLCEYVHTDTKTAVNLKCAPVRAAVFFSARYILYAEYNAIHKTQLVFKLAKDCNSCVHILYSRQHVLSCIQDDHLVE